jgi:alpha,alpha-trehalase
LETVIEYNTVWMVQGKRLTRTGLNRYKSDARAWAFDDVLALYAVKYNLPVREFESNI